MGFKTAIAHLNRDIQNGSIPGGVLAMTLTDGSRELHAAGMAQIEPGPQKMLPETWFDLASLTKVIFTTERILRHAAQGAIDLDEPLVSVLPDLRQYDFTAWERKVTFRQCLGHQTPFPAVEPIYTYGEDPERLRAFVLQREWNFGAPVYSDINFILLGIALERIEGCRIREMKPGFGLSFSPTGKSIAATELCPWRGRVLQGEVHDENCFALQGSGHAGLFGTADAVLDFAKTLLTRNINGDARTSLLRMPLSATRAHGWERPYKDWSGGDSCSPDTLGHTGYTGTGLWVDFERGCSWTLLTNCVHPSRHTESGIAELRRAVGTAICERD